MALSNPTWGEERIANEVLLKLGIRVSPRTCASACPNARTDNPVANNAGPPLFRNHAEAILACDFCVVVTATFQLLYLLLVIEHHTRRIVHCGVTTQPTAASTLQHFSIY